MNRTRLFVLTTFAFLALLLFGCGLFNDTPPRVPNTGGKTAFHVPYRPSPTTLDGRCEQRGTEMEKARCRRENDERLTPDPDTKTMKRPGLPKRG